LYISLREVIAHKQESLGGVPGQGIGTAVSHAEPRRMAPLDDRAEYGTIYSQEVPTMSMVDDIRPITYLKSRAADLLKQVNETHRPVIITQNGEPRAVLQDPESYESMREALGLLKLISQGEEDIRKGKITPQEEVFSRIEKVIGKR